MFMSKKIETHILTFSFEDQIGIVAKISSLLAKFKCNIVESKQFTDTLNGNFFIRQSFTLVDNKELESLEIGLKNLSCELNGDFLLSEIENEMNTILLVSKFDHCLNDLLFRVRNKSLNLNIKAIISNHRVAEEIANFSNIPFYYLPVAKDIKYRKNKKSI